MAKIGVIGAGAWGTALAQTIAGEEEREVLLWAREPAVVESVNTLHENTLFLPRIKLNKAITAVNSLSGIVDCDVLLIVTPAQHVRETLVALKGELAKGVPAVLCAKGIEMKTGLLLSQVADEEAPTATLGVLTGPTFANEIAAGLPSAVTIAARDKDIAERIRDIVSSRYLRCYISDDLLGAQIGGAVKNVIAIAAGIVAGKKLGDSARAALITRGLTEMGRLASAMGAKRETLMGMCGVGDLVLTASSMQSRNYSLGVQLGEGRILSDILRERQSVTEGVYTAAAIKTLSQKNAVDMPICDAVNRFLNEGAVLGDIIEGMMDRPLKPRAETH
jgi:glycerol-3-phosphate dehydrogenase (NAD(P)+)